MKKFICLHTVLFFLICVGSFSCMNDKIANEDTLNIKEKISNSQVLLDEFVKNGDFINSNKIPTLIDAKEVNQLIDSNVLIIDIRGAKYYAEGHIKNAIKLKYNELIDFFQVSGTQDYDKVILVCYTGQSASYATAVLQFLGYKNVYAMNRGMCAWNKKFSKKWLKNSTDRLIDKLEKKSNNKNNITKLPDFESHKKAGAEILNIRANKLLDEGFKEAAITIDDIISEPGAFYIVSYQMPEIYELGHLKSAILYNPNKSLKKNTELLTMPVDKTIVVYSNSGQYSAYVTVFLRMLGYDAKTLKYGANGFMNKFIIENIDTKQGFSEEIINNFNFETSEYEEEESGVEEGGC